MESGLAENRDTDIYAFAPPQACISKILTQKAPKPKKYFPAFARVLRNFWTICPIWSSDLDNLSNFPQTGLPSFES
jgi:hypothetical protein